MKEKAARAEMRVEMEDRRVAGKGGGGEESRGEGWKRKGKREKSHTGRRKKQTIIPM